MEREIRGTPHSDDASGRYVPPAHEPDHREFVPYLSYQIDGRPEHEIGAFIGAVSGDGFTADPAHLESIAKDWERLARRFRRKIQLASYLTTTVGPGAEYASDTHAEAVRKAGRAMVEAFKNRQQYCEDQARKFRTAAGHYAKADDHASQQLPPADDQSPGSLF